MKLTRLEINGFRGLYRAFDLSGDIIITAGNGKGKTTFLCALLWLLCGVDDEDKVNYNLFDNKLPADNPDEPLQMSVVGCFDTIMLRRDARQKWGKDKMGNIIRKGDEYAYRVNDMEVSATRFNEIIEQNFMPIPLLKFALNVRRWELLDERVLREQICKLASDDSKPTDAKYDTIQWALKESGVDGAKKHFAQRRREYEGTAKDLALEISANKSMLPDVGNVNAMQSELDAANAELETIEQRITAQIPTDVLQRRQDEECAIFEKKAAYKQAEIEYVAEGKSKVAAAESEYTHAIAAMNRNKQRREQLREAQRQYDIAEADYKRLKNEYEQCTSRIFTGYCPSCGQELQGSCRTEKLEAFKAQTAADELRITTEGKIVADKKAKLQAEIERLESEIVAEKSTDVLGAERRLWTTKAKYDVPFADTDVAKSLQAEIAMLEAARTEMPDTATSDADKARKGELLLTIEKLRNDIAVSKHNAEIADKLHSVIYNLELRKNNALRYMGENETSLRLVKEYETEWAQMLQTSINAQFNKIRIRMNDVTKSGEIIDCCKVEMASVADTLNLASKVVAGIEISLAFQRKHDVSLPMIIDNAESVERDRIYTDDRQTIMLYMREGEELNIKNI